MEPVRRLAPATPRRARRVAETRARILATAARRFAAEGVDAVRLDVLADEADVARGTLYNYFPTKASLVSGVMEPVLRHAAAATAGLHRLGPRRGVEALLDLYLELWRRFPDALRCAWRMQEQPLTGELARLHGQFLGGVLAVFTRAARARILRAGDATLAAATLARVAIPLLELYEGEPRRPGLFTASMRGLLLAPRAPARLR